MRRRLLIINNHVINTHLSMRTKKKKRETFTSDLMNFASLNEQNTSERL